MEMTKGTSRAKPNFMDESDIMTPKSYGSLDPTIAETKLLEGNALPDEATRALSDRFHELTKSDQVEWTVRYELIHKLGSGGQGEVFLGDRCGAYGATFRLAIKFFRPMNYANVEEYRREMSRQARVAMMLAGIQQDELLDIHNFVDFGGVDALTMEWVDGYDLRQLLTADTLDNVRKSVDRDRWNYINDVIVTKSKDGLRFKPGVAIAILRETLAGLAALHRVDIVHADVKPANIMIKRTGSSKLIDFGSAFHLLERPIRPSWTPRYAALEVLLGAAHTPASDLASAGYVLFELLSGRYPFADVETHQSMIQAKKRFPDDMEGLLPPEVATNNKLLTLLQGLTAPDPEDRFSSAEEADLLENGAADFQRELVKSDLSSEYQNEIRLWMEELK